ncbi:ABC transporter substrate-binding protein [Nocardioides sp. LHG3406-4]|uniref:ABC transporter substrate-binding protein n=1 Tax=Nocardioides sp. LHG3406-4 TaxID=2804575 RepID=UPI003CEE9FB1
MSALGACGGAGGSGSDTEDGVVLGPSRFESITNAALVVGAESGTFDTCGLDVELKAAGGGGNSVQALESGAIDFIMPSLSAVIPGFQKGANIVVVAGDSVGTNGMAWLVPKDSPLQSVEDLAGKKASVSAINSNTDASLQSVLRANDVDPDDVERVVIAEVGAGLAALASGTVDAVWATEPSVTLFEQTGDVRVLFRTDDFIPEFQLTVLATRKDLAEEDPELVEDVVDCLRTTREAARADIEGVGTAFAESAKLEPDVAVDVLKRSIGNDEDSLDLNVPGIQAALDAATLSGLVPADTTLTDLSDLWMPADGVEIVGGSLN